MVLEALVNPFRAEKRPWELMFLGMIYCSIGIFISLQVFESAAGILSVFLTVMACIPLMYAIMKYEEHKDHDARLSEIRLLREHGKALLSLTSLFIGIVAAYVLWYLFLPPEAMTNLFSLQHATIQQINAAAVTGAMTKVALFEKIFLNNMKVLMFCLLFSFFYGAGAIFILVWNASVVSAAIGNLIRNNLGDIADAVGLTKVGAYFHVVSSGFLRYFVHGIPEIAGYFVAGLAGGIISIGVIKHDMRSKQFNKIMLDAALLALISIIITLIAAVIEVWVTPMFYV